MNAARFLTPLVLLLAVLAAPAHGEDFSRLPTSQRTTLGLYLTPQEAYDRIRQHPKDTLFVDVRAPEELAFLGVAPVIDANIPFYLVARPWEWDAQRKSLKLEPNPDFLGEMEKRLADKGLGKDGFIILMCGTARRSARAVNFLASLGYTHAYTVVQGFEGDGPESHNGWKNAGLPWGFALEREKLYGIGN